MTLPKNTVVHLIKRGARGLPIVKDTEDKYRVLKLLYFLNDSNRPLVWERDVSRIASGLHFERPQQWEKERSPYVDILAYCLMDNHIHFLLCALQDGGIGDFVGAVSSSMSQFFNNKYKTVGGSIFHRPTKFKIVEDDRYLNHLNFYINVKNPLELYPGGLKKAVTEFDVAFKHALEYPFSSLPDAVGRRNSPIVATDRLSTTTIIPSEEFQSLAKAFMQRKFPSMEIGGDSIFLE